MKSKFLILFFLLTSCIIYAQQSYKHCLDEERTKWSIIYEPLDDLEHSLELMAYVDTIINEVSYKRIYMTEYYEFEDTNTKWKDRIDYGSDFGQYHIRESADASQLYIYDAYWNKEYLVSDMNLEIGDRFPIPEIWDHYSFLSNIDTLVVDSVYIQDGLKHVRFDHTWKTHFYLEEHYSSYYHHYIDYDYHVTFIEGIGPNIGMIDSSWHTIEQIVNCFQNQSIYWKNEYVSYPCGYFYSHTGIDFFSSGSKYSVHLNKEDIEIFPSTNEPLQLTLYNIMGKICYSQSFSIGQTMLIPRSSLPHGIYLLKIVTKNKRNFQILKISL